MYAAHLLYFLSRLLVAANMLFLVNYLLTAIIIARRMPREGDAFRKVRSRVCFIMEKMGKLIPSFRLRGERREG